jgi:iron complex outermembrane receptor protein
MQLACARRVLLCLTCVTASLRAIAQDETIQEIVVHGQQGATRVSEFPVSVSTVGMRQIERWTLTSLEDLEQLVPNLNIQSQFAYNNVVSIRGVGAFSRNIGFDERVGLYLDGIYLGPNYGLNQNLLDLEQAEIFRGPQGTLFGRNSIAGAVQLISTRPAAEAGGELTLRAGTRGTRVAQGRFSVPLSPELAFSVSAGQHRRDGLTFNRFTGNTLDNKHRTNARAQLLYTPTDTFEARLTFDDNRLDEDMLLGDPVSDTFGTAPDTAAPGPFRVDFNISPVQSVTTRGAGLVLDWTLQNGATLQSWTGLRETGATVRNDLDYSRLDILHVDYAEDYDHVTQELRYTATVNDDLQYLFGLHYLDQSGATDRHVIAGTSGGLLGMTNRSDLWNAGVVDTRSASVYGSIETLFAGYEVSLGLRWSRERKDADWQLHTLAATHFGLGHGAFQRGREDTDLTPTLSLGRAINDDVRWFARYAEGFKSGGYNLDYVSATIFPNGLEFKKESARSYEAGIKGSFSRSSASFSATAFRVDYHDFQVNQFRDLGGGNTIILITNAAQVRTQGLELELASALSPNLSFTGSLALLDARYLRFVDGGIGGSDASGKRLDAPKFAAAVSLAYERPLANGVTGFIDANVSYNGDYYITADNISRQQLQGGGSVPYGRVSEQEAFGLRLGLTDRAETWRVVLWAQNLGDEDGVTSGLRDFFGTIVETRREPRTAGIELAYRF